mgnify:CR=1 FL=1
MSKNLNKIGLNSKSFHLKRAIIYFIKEHQLDSIFSFEDLRHLLSDYCQNKLEPIYVVKGMKEVSKTIQFYPSSSDTLEGFLNNIRKEVLHFSSEENILNINFTCEYPDFCDDLEPRLEIKHLAPETEEDYSKKSFQKQMIDFLLDNYESIKDKAILYQNEAKKSQEDEELKNIHKQIELLKNKAEKIKNS